MNQLENLYRQIIMDHYKHPRNKGLLDDPHYQTEHLKNPSCGDDITIQTWIEGNRVKDVRHDGSGCSICCSSASVLTTLVKGKTIEEAAALVKNYHAMLLGKTVPQPNDLEDAIAYQGVTQFPARIKCASIAWSAFEATLKKARDTDE